MSSLGGTRGRLVPLLVDVAVERRGLQPPYVCNGKPFGCSDEAPENERKPCYYGSGKSGGSPSSPVPGPSIFASDAPELRIRENVFHRSIESAAR